MIIAAIDQRHVHRQALQMLRRTETSKPATQNDYTMSICHVDALQQGRDLDRTLSSCFHYLWDARRSKRNRISRSALLLGYPCFQTKAGVRRYRCLGHFWKCEMQGCSPLWSQCDLLPETTEKASPRAPELREECLSKSGMSQGENS